MHKLYTTENIEIWQIFVAIKKKIFQRFDTHKKQSENFLPNDIHYGQFA